MCPNLVAFLPPRNLERIEGIRVVTPYGCKDKSGSDGALECSKTTAWDVPPIVDFLWLYSLLGKPDDQPVTVPLVSPAFGPLDPAFALVLEQFADFVGLQMADLESHSGHVCSVQRWVQQQEAWNQFCDDAVKV
jgi:hypothetical protein